MSANSPSSHGAPESPRHLPGHIAAALARAGSPSDSAGQSWEGRDLSGEGNPLHDFDNDNGLIDVKLAVAMDALIAGTGSEQGVHAALAQSRIYIAVVAQLAEGGLGEHGFTEEKEADMALVTLNAPDGRKALPVFGGASKRQAWHGEARPVAVYAPRAALSAVAEEAQMLVLDPGADFTFVLRRPRHVGPGPAKGVDAQLPRRGSCGHRRPTAGAEEALASVRIAPGQGVGSRTAQGTSVPGGGSGPELRLEFTFQPGVDEATARACVSRIHSALAANADFAENVDSLEVSLKAGAPSTSRAQRMKFGRYGELLRQPGVAPLLLVGMVARLPHAAVGMLLLLHLVNGLDRDWGSAGLVVALMTIGIALGAPWRGRVVDVRAAPRIAALDPRRGGGVEHRSAGFVRVGAAAGVPWRAVLVARLLRGARGLGVMTTGETRRSAFALDAMATELVFIVGPATAGIVATSLSTTIGMIGIAVAAWLTGLALMILNPPTRSGQPGAVAKNANPHEERLAAEASLIASGPGGLANVEGELILAGSKSAKARVAARGKAFRNKFGWVSASVIAVGRSSASTTSYCSMKELKD